METAAETETGSTPNNLKDKLRRIFDEAQKSFASHRKLVLLLQNILKESEDLDKLLAYFVENLNRVLIVFQREASVERVIDFVISFVSTVSQGNVTLQSGKFSTDDFLSAILQYLASIANSRSKATRFRSCQLVAGILNSLGDEAEISDEAWDRVADEMLFRARDKYPAIRVQAVHSLKRLQDPTDPEDDVTAEYIRLLVTDSSKDVRKAVLKSIGVTRLTLRHILTRIRDVKEDVRQLCFNVLKEKLELRQLTISQRIDLIDHGLKDRDPSVRDACADMILNGWLPNVDNDLVKLVDALDIEDNEATAAMAVRQLLKKSEGDEAAVKVPLIPIAKCDDLNPALAFIWRLQVQLAKGNDEKLDQLVPDTLTFCNVLSSVRESLPEDQEEMISGMFVMKQLLLAARHLDFMDEVGRQRLLCECRNLLMDLRLDGMLVEPTMSVLRCLHRTETSYIQLLTEIMAELYDPLEDEEDEDVAGDEPMQAAEGANDESSQSSLSEEEKSAAMDRLAAIHEQLDAFEKMTDPTVEDEQAYEKLLKEAEELEQKLSGDQPRRWYRCLLICEDLLTYTRKSVKHVGLSSVRQFIVPAIQLEIPQLRELGIKCLGLFCSMDEALCQTFLPLFLQIATSQDEETSIREISTQAVVDMCLIFPSLLRPHLSAREEELPLEENEDAPDKANADKLGLSFEERVTLSTKIVETYTELLDNDSTPTLQSRMAEGLAKLLFADRYPEESKALSKLLLIFFRPDLENEERLRQVLSVFLPAYAVASSHHQRMILEAAVPTMRAILDASARSPLHSVPLSKVMQFILYLLTPTEEERRKRPDGSSVEATSQLHNELAIEMCKEVLRAPTGPMLKDLARVIPYFLLHRGDMTGIRSLRLIVEEMLERVDDKALLKALEKWEELIAEMDSQSSPPKSAEAEELAEQMEGLQVELEELRNPRGRSSGADGSSRQLRGKRALLRRVRHKEANSDDSDHGRSSMESANSTVGGPRRSSRSRRSTENPTTAASSKAKTSSKLTRSSGKGTTENILAEIDNLLD